MYKNYINIHHIIPFRKKFMYIDVEDYLADDIFETNNLSVRISDKEFKKEDSEYIISICTIYSKDTDKFIECMDRLKNKIQIFGYKDYSEVCEVFNLNFLRMRYL